jgi:hypothetical protein
MFNEPDHRRGTSRRRIGLEPGEGRFFMSTQIYEAPALREVGDFDELTKCLGVGSCVDFLGCGRAIICFW